MLVIPLKIPKNNVITIIIFGILWGSISVAYATALNSANYSLGILSTSLFYPSYTIAFFRWTILLPYILFFPIQGILLFPLNLLSYTPFYNFSLATAISIITEIFFTSLFAIVFLVLFKFFIKRLSVILQINKNILILFFIALLICLAVTAGLLDTYQEKIVTNEINNTFSAINFPDQILTQKINTQCTLYDCTTIGFKLYTSPDNYLGIVSKINTILMRQGKQCDELNSYLTGKHDGYIEIPCNNGLTILIYHNNQLPTNDQITSSEFVEYITNIELPIPIYKSLYGGNNDAYLNSFTYGVGISKQFINPKYNSLLNLLGSIFSIPL